MPDTPQTLANDTQPEAAATTLQYVNGRKQLAKVRVSGEHREKMDAQSMAEVVIMLARELQLKSQQRQNHRNDDQ